MRYLLIGDTHFPFVSHAKLKKVVQWAKEHQPDYIFQIGDLYDNYAFSKYTKAVNYLTPEQELKRGRKLAEKMWMDIKTACPKAKCYQLLGNHCVRIIKRVMEKLPALDMKVKLKDKVQKLHNIDALFEFPGVVTSLSDRQEIDLHGMKIIHGFKGNIGEHCRFFNKCVVTGHLHRGGIVTERRGNKTIWELNCGYVGDEKSLPFQYTDTKTTRWTPGFGVVETECGILVPRFIPL